MLNANDFGWHEGNMPGCCWCARTIMVRGDKGFATLAGPVLRTETGAKDGDGAEIVRIDHFYCIRNEWWDAELTDDPGVRISGRRRYFLVLPSNAEWWMEQNDIRWARGRKFDEKPS